MSPAGRTWGVNNKAGSLSNPETGGTESGTRRENTRDKQRIHQENEARKDKKKRKRKRKIPKWQIRIKVHQAQMNRRENQKDFLITREQIFISKQKK